MKRRNFLQLIAVAAMSVSARVACAEPPGIVEVPEPLLILGSTGTLWVYTDGCCVELEPWNA